MLVSSLASCGVSAVDRPGVVNDLICITFDESALLNGREVYSTHAAGLLCMWRSPCGNSLLIPHLPQSPHFPLFVGFTFRHNFICHPLKITDFAIMPSRHCSGEVTKKNKKSKPEDPPVYIDPRSSKQASSWSNSKSSVSSDCAQSRDFKWSSSSYTSGKDDMRK